ncbi:MAG: hypothetical protein Q9P14_02925 [candidate division KSB1 bacterium]|nr:hypothetical protein [candidate division KSB1 bacterium]MDQ7063650.1 hypothetical protein [candidate division KSB1 bacterium]
MSIATVVLKKLGLNEDEALREIALFHASQKLAEFQQDCDLFEKKYSMTFIEFEKKNKSEKTENVERDEDFFAWKFAHEGMLYWQEKVEKLQKSKCLLY